MNPEPENRATRGLSEVNQYAIEKRAFEIAKAAGRDDINGEDLTAAGHEIAGKFASGAAPEETERALGRQQVTQSDPASKDSGRSGPEDAAGQKPRVAK